ncbi:SDR family oxidoreductase [Cellulomonas sp.]|uniref:SDR family oxidoreductase n=1 Tax=Cellulomonas sp. TaxID=40001 RepID=UPI0028110686|nr:SDR family oxidoreductase [Cellulomonas sp.]
MTQDHDDAGRRPVALITGVGRTRGIGAGVARGLAASGWDIAFTYYSAYDTRMPWGGEPGATDAIADELRAAGAEAVAIEADLADPLAADQVLDRAVQALGGVQALVMCHCESVASGILDTSVESFDRHFAVNARATWLLIRAFAERAEGEDARRRVIALTSDHTVGNLPYGASKAALDRITLAAASELAHLGVRANVINPGPIDTGWMTEAARAAGTRQTPLGRLGTPSDTADLVTFLCSAQGGWITGQLLHSSGGFA